MQLLSVLGFSDSSLLWHTTRHSLQGTLQSCEQESLKSCFSTQHLMLHSPDVFLPKGLWNHPCTLHLGRSNLLFSFHEPGAREKLQIAPSLFCIVACLFSFSVGSFSLQILSGSQRSSPLHFITKQLFSSAWTLTLGEADFFCCLLLQHLPRSLSLLLLKKINESFIEKGMQFDTLMLTEINRTQKNKYYLVFLI